jgi:triacylglycerol esterase/lipase EstA (alpha/beta hydrolase family)
MAHKTYQTKTKQKLITSAIGLVISSLATNTFAGGSADFTINGTQVTSSQIDILASQSKSLRYNGGSNACTDVEWYLRKEGESTWKNFDHDGSATLEEIHRAGSHELKMTARGYDGRYFFNLLGCDHRGQYDERSVNLNIAVPGYTQTENPIMLVPGVLAWDDIFGMEYFYRVGDEIEKTSDFEVKDVSLAAWQNTEDRGADLARKILDFLIINDENFFDEDSEMKVNLIAHSHGSTTSRMAINILAKAFADFDNKKVASLTTMAGPHYGTPTADGAIWAIENWEENGKFLEKYVVDGLVGDLAGTLSALLSGHASEYPEQDILSVMSDFTQKGMARFNSCYPSAGVPKGGKYFIEEPLEGNEPYVPFPEIIDGQVSFDDCKEYGINPSTGKFETTGHFSTGPVDIDLAEIPNDAYGADTVLYNAPVYGDGLGNTVDSNSPSAIRYFSFMGDAPWNTRFGLNVFDGETPAELADVFMLVVNSLHPLPGQRTDKDHFWTWLLNTGETLITGSPVEVNPNITDQGYSKASDAFIPVESTPFGQHIATFPGWNHVDEINALFGLVGEGSADPVAVYRGHINRLQANGL